MAKYFTVTDCWNCDQFVNSPWLSISDLATGTEPYETFLVNLELNKIHISH